MDNQKVSVVITTYKGSENLARAVDSCLEQTYGNLEVIVVDDNDPGTDARKDTRSVMERYANDARVKYIMHETNKNGSAARNTGIAAASGTFVQLLDDDDYLFNKKIELSVAALRENVNCSMAVTGVIALGEYGIGDLSGAYEASDNFIVSREWLKRGNALGTGSNIFATKESIDGIGGFDESYIRMQDIEFIMRYCERYTVCSIPDRLIVKDLNDRPAALPDYEKNHAVIAKFTAQFAPLIARLLTENEANGWYASQYAHLLRIALADGDSDRIATARAELEKYRGLTRFERIKVKHYRAWHAVRHNSFLRNVKSVAKHKSGAGEMESLLSGYESEQLRAYTARYVSNSKG